MKWFISDLHLDHSAVLIGPRGRCFPTLEDWQPAILDAINSNVKSGDSLYILGDFAFSDVKKWRTKLSRGDNWLIVGNHDQSKSRLFEAFGTQRVRDTLMAKLCGDPCWLSHYPHAFWPASHRGSYHLYGHIHGQREDTLDALFPDRRSLDVSPEVAYKLFGEWRPMNEEELHAILSKRPGHDQVDFYHERQKAYSDKADNSPGDVPSW